MMTYIYFLILSFIGSTQINEERLVWTDEFDKSGLPDSTKWSYDKGDGCPHVCGWGNNELQYYTWEREENARVENGKLIIEAHKEDFENKKYTSARLVSKNKGDWKYGKIEIRAKLPSGKGTWPAIWMLPTLKRNMKWPDDGEIDIMEHVGYQPEWIYGTIHTGAFNHIKGTQKIDSIKIPDAETAFHVYTLKWTPEHLQWLVDDKIYHTVKSTESYQEWPFNNNFHLILNLAVGGGWGGRHGVDETIWPQRMEVDYVRVYQNPNF